MENIYNRILVVPSNRPDNFKDFINKWIPYKDWNHIVLVEDNPTKTFDEDFIKYHNISHFSWKEIDETLGENSWIISRRDSAIRSFGFLVAKRLGADYILTLDDDCYPHEYLPIFETHIQNMQSTFKKWTESIPGMRTRGLPYKNLGKLNVVASMGLWTNVPDLDAVHSLNDRDHLTYGGFRPEKGNRIIPPGQFFPISGMNYCFHSSVIPLSYFPIMGEGSPYRRFDDIWHGIIFKKIIDHLGLYISVGEPFVEHQRASDVFVNLVKEAPGIKTNEWFWEEIDKVYLKGNTPEICMREMGIALRENADNYISELGKAIGIWVDEVEKD